MAIDARQPVCPPVALRGVASPGVAARQIVAASKCASAPRVSGERESQSAGAAFTALRSPRSAPEETLALQNKGTAPVDAAVMLLF